MSVGSADAGVDMVTRRRLSFRFVAFSVVPVCILLLTGEVATRFKYYFAHDYDWHYLTTPFPLDARTLPLEQQMPEQVRTALQRRTPAEQRAPASLAAIPRPATPVAPATAPIRSAPASTLPVQRVFELQNDTTQLPTVTVAQTPAMPEASRSADASMKATLSAPSGGRTRIPPQSTAIGLTQARQAIQEPVSQVSQKDQMAFLWPSPCVSGTVYSTERHSVLPRTWDANCFRGDALARHKSADEYRVAFQIGRAHV